MSETITTESRTKESIPVWDARAMEGMSTVPDIIDSRLEEESAIGLGDGRSASATGQPSATGSSDPADGNAPVAEDTQVLHGTTPGGKPLQGLPTPTQAPSEDQILEAMKDVVDPELGIDVVNLGLVYAVHISGTKVVLDMTLTSAACPLTDVIEEQTILALEGLVTSMRINWIWLPPWGPERITDEGREMLQALGFNV
ncbi:MAG: metal-sulfur cluster assembly factor [Actinomycetaceae bacterium]|nr:metal-sulfur cluster assembly factor [Actinomycetaceae bacterium]